MNILIMSDNHYHPMLCWAIELPNGIFQTYSNVPSSHGNRVVRQTFEVFNESIVMGANSHPQILCLVLLVGGLEDSLFFQVLVIKDPK